MSDKRCVRLQSNLLQQNIYIRDCARASDVETSVCEKYPELERRDTDCGFEERVVSRDYPITPESLNSFAETADYKNNLVEAMHAPSRGKGLGDIRDMQDLQNMDSVEIRNRIASLQKVLVQKESVSADTSTNTKKEGEN